MMTYLFTFYTSLAPDQKFADNEMRKKYDAALLARTSTSLLLILFIPSICRDAKIEYPIVENQMSECHLTHEKMSIAFDRNHRWNSAISQADALKRREGFMVVLDSLIPTW